MQSGVPLIVAITLASLVWLPPRLAVAQSLEQEIDWCANENNTYLADQQISGCTAEIKSGRLAAKALAFAFDHRGLAYHAKGDLDGAIVEYTEAIRLDPKLSGTYYHRANAYRDKGDYDRAIADYDEAISLYPKAVQAYNGRGLAYQAEENFDHAIADFDEAIRLDPRFAGAYVGRGMTYNLMGNFDRAIAEYDEAIRLDPTYARGYFNRGLTSLFTSALPNALDDLDHAVRLDPKDAYAALWLDIIDKRSSLPSRLAHAVARIDMTKWPAPIIRFYLGQDTLPMVFNVANDHDLTTEENRVCQANFYAGELALQEAEIDKAKRLFTLSAEHCPKAFIERWAAYAELTKLGEQLYVTCRKQSAEDVRYGIQVPCEWPLK